MNIFIELPGVWKGAFFCEINRSRDFFLDVSLDFQSLGWTQPLADRLDLINRLPALQFFTRPISSIVVLPWTDMFAPSVGMAFQEYRAETFTANRCDRVLHYVTYHEDVGIGDLMSRNAV